MAVLKDGLPSSAFLVVGDPAETSTWHLPVRDAAGKADHGHMGEAYAALHAKAGFRGNPYAGPGKGPAIEKLNALYQHEGIPTPDSKTAAEKKYKPTGDEANDGDADDVAASEQPSGGDGGGGLHIDVPLGGKRRARRSHFSSHLMGAIRTRMNERGYVHASELNDMIAQARGHAGAKAKALAKRASMVDTAPDTIPCTDCLTGNDAACICPGCEASEDCMCSEMMAPVAPYGPSALRYAEANVVTASGDEFRLFMEQSYAEGTLPDWINYLPTPGKFKHSKYGDVNITADRNADFVSKFNAGVYQTQIPVDGEHDTKLSGAMAWVKEMRLNADGSADARVDWTDRGKAMMEGDRYKYFSPEWFDEWKDPLTGEVVKNVAIGGALTTRPFFKEGKLRALVASEAGIQVSDPPEKPIAPRGAGDNVPPRGRGATPMANDPAVFAEEQTRKFAELEQKFAEQAAALAAAKTATEQLQAAANQANERAEALERENRRKTFAETARTWVGDVNGHVAFMEGLTDEQRAFYTTQQAAFAEQRKASNLFKEAGAPGVADNGGTPAARAHSQIKARMQEASLDFATASAQVFSEDPGLYALYKAGTAIGVSPIGAE